MQILKNLSAVLNSAGSGLDKVVKVNVFLTSMDNFDAMNRGYKSFFKDPLPVSAALIPRLKLLTFWEGANLRVCQGSTT